MQERTFNISAADMATLMLISTAIQDIINTQEVSADILEELTELQSELDRIVFEQKESPLYDHQTKSAV